MLKLSYFVFRMLAVKGTVVKHHLQSMLHCSFYCSIVYLNFCFVSPFFFFSIYLFLWETVRCWSENSPINQHYTSGQWMDLPMLLAWKQSKWNERKKENRNRIETDSRFWHWTVWLTTLLGFHFISFFINLFCNI